MPQRIDASIKFGTYIAGSQNILNLAKRDGIDLVNPDDLLDEVTKQEIMQWVHETTVAMQIAMAAVELEEAETSVVLSQTIKRLFQIAGPLALENGLRLPTIDPLTISVPDFQKVTHKPRNLAPPFGRMNSRLILDFSSSSGKSASSNDENRWQVSAKHDPCFGLANFAANFWRGITKQNRVRFDIAPLPKQPTPSATANTIGTSVKASDISRWAEEILLEFHHHKHAILAFLKGAKNLPPAATFNNTGEVKLAAYIDALGALGVPTEMASHGAMVAHGTGARLEISSILANGIYNHCPGIEPIVPRSPLQVPEGFPENRIRKTSRLTPVNQKTTDRPFTIYYAPNFLKWDQCFHGLSPSCFETRACAEGLAAAFRKLENAKLNIRVKTTVADVAKKDPSVERGLLPEDLEDLYDPANNINNCAYGSHKALIEEADLVITEGVTAVMFEALEYRIPVLLLNKSPERTPSLPAAWLKELKATHKRFAVYASGVEPGLAELLGKIKEKHFDHVLMDEELSSLVWT